MNLKEKSRIIGEDLKEIGHLTLNLATVAGVFIGITAGINGAAMGLQAGIESLQNPERGEFIGTLKEKDYTKLAAIHGHLDYGTFELPNGTSFRVYDTSKVLERKWFPNTEISKLEENMVYKVKFIGSERLGYTILEAEPKN